MNDADEALGHELADAAERGDLHPIPGTTLRGQDAADAARAMLMAATDTHTPQDAARVALGRPRVGESRPETRHWRVRVPDTLDDAAHAIARRDGLSVSEVIRRAVEVGLRADLATSPGAPGVPS